MTSEIDNKPFAKETDLRSGEERQSSIDVINLIKRIPPALIDALTNNLLDKLEIFESNPQLNQGQATSDKLPKQTDVKHPRDFRHDFEPTVINVNRSETLGTGDRYTFSSNKVPFAGAGVLDGTGASVRETLQTPDGYGLNIDSYDKWGHISRSIQLKTPDGTTINGISGGDYSDWSVTRADGTLESTRSGLRGNNFSVQSQQGRIGFSVGSSGDVTISTPGGGRIVVGHSGLSSVSRNNSTSPILRH